MNSNKKEAQARLVKKTFSVLGIATLFFQASCARPSSTVSMTPETSIPPAGLATPPPSITPKLSFTPTHELSPTLEPAWQQTIETQDLQDKFFKIENGQPVIDLYDTQAPESIGLNLESIKIMAATDGLNPNILAAKDADGNQYAFNPDYGWFKVPEVQMNYIKLEEYTEVDQAYIEDGRANLVTALNYAENPTISPNAVAPQYWANYGADGNSNFVFLSYNPSGDLGTAQKMWPDLLARSYFKPENKPFAWTGFYKIHLETGKSIYVIGRTIKTGDNQTTNLFYGFDQKAYEGMANNMLPSGRTELKLMFDGTNNGGMDFVVIMPPPEKINNISLPWNPDLVHRTGPTNPDVARLQERGKLISLFSTKDQKTILDLLSLTPVEMPSGEKIPIGTSPLDFLPPELSKFILLPGGG